MKEQFVKIYTSILKHDGKIEAWPSNKGYIISYTIGPSQGGTLYVGMFNESESYWAPR